MPRENQRIALTKRLLKESLVRLMETKNIQKISVSELCKDAGINRATFYNHYSMPTDILEEMGDDMAEEIHALLMREKLGGKDALEKKVEFVCEYLLENQRTAKLLFRNHTPESEFAGKLLRTQDNWELVCGNLQQAYGQEGKELLMTFFVHGLYCMMTQWLLDDMKKTPEEMGQLICSISIRGFIESSERPNV